MKIVLWFFVRFGLSISEADLLVESQLCNTVSLKEPFGVVSTSSTALYVPSDFIGRRFETTPDLSFSKHVKTALAKRYSNSNQRFRFGN
ncbi:hypothetical protein ND932_15210 [Vibrio diabolicus]|nr:hypothetical protein [Vibrio diabolicus]